ncbi:hypothetical protein ACJ2_17680 [Pantoea sp. QMID2]|nr:hypothetical protein ACJ1_24000 [Pantoea sp. QMID1]GME40475.1 hypothetical protein ACJ3_25680 [Pantoea sp. QMID3]GME54878.1 hypothetical protein ACJ4_17650 [Pantoea sp. QMID4]GME55883.1 hypothetical protein ACJ2_17680 [Pantoea sp. QMID2]
MQAETKFIINISLLSSTSEATKRRPFAKKREVYKDITILKLSATIKNTFIPFNQELKSTLCKEATIMLPIINKTPFIIYLYSTVESEHMLPRANCTIVTM